MSRRRLEPSPDHPITVAPLSRKVTVSYAGTPIAVTDHALELREASYPPVYYVPAEDLVAEVFTPSESTSYCPFKGDAGYVDATVEGQVVTDAGWVYHEPYPAVAEIAGHVAFYPSKVSVEVA